MVSFRFAFDLLAYFIFKTVRSLETGWIAVANFTRAGSRGGSHPLYFYFRARFKKCLHCFGTKRVHRFHDFPGFIEATFLRHVIRSISSSALSGSAMNDKKGISGH